MSENLENTTVLLNDLTTTIISGQRGPPEWWWQKFYDEFAILMSVLAIQSIPYIIVDLAVFVSIMKHKALRDHWPLPLIAMTCFGEALNGCGYVAGAFYHVPLIVQG